MSAYSGETSLWQRALNNEASYPSLDTDLTAETVVVGGGITGLTTALLLQEAGHQVVLLEANRIGSGVSGFNSGHLTTILLDTDYSTVLRNFGAQKAIQAAESQKNAMVMIRDFIQRYNIPCDYRVIDGYLYAEQVSHVKSLESEFEAIQKVGIACEMVDQAPLPFPIERAIRIPEQARFQPLAYLHGLASQFITLGGRIFEQSRAINFRHGDMQTIECENGRSVTATHLVLATHSPVGLWPATQTRIEAMQSYIIGVRVSSTAGDAVFWDMEDNYHYTRWSADERGPLLIIGGEDHRTGERRDTMACYRALESYAKSHYDVTAVDYRWSAELFDPADGLPYIGRVSTAKNTYIATGLSGEGLTGGTYAGRIISDQILGIENLWTELYNPERLKPIASAGGFISENIGTAMHFVGDKLRAADVQDPEDLLPGEGAILQYENQKVAAYRDDTGLLHMLSPKCTHMGCNVNWNNAAKSWDCPCHGGRFMADGTVLHGPPSQPLARISPVEKATAQ